MASVRWVIFCFLLPLAWFGAAAWAVEKDKPGTHDHPLVSRYQGSVLHNQGSSGFEQVELPLSRYDAAQQPAKPVKSQRVEGKVLNYAYWGPVGRSDLEVFRNYQSALAKSGFVLLFVCDEPARCQADGLGKFSADWTGRSSSFQGGYDAQSRMDDSDMFAPRFLVAQLKGPQGDVYVSLTVRPPSSVQDGKGVGPPYFLQVVEVQAMRTDAVTVNAAALQKGLAADGKVALYGVFFDTGSAVVKAESKAQLDEMARLMAASPALKVFIVGHTDNVGDLSANLALSQRRAEAIAAWLAQNGKVDARRLNARGIANVSPVAANDSEAGRARNRRVELVAQ